eukprot:CAMPEP_0181327314 /NCGR_PEP_ID=MMETSP1101-20121128/22031_1 /TAXON_ID=46948 /ORGANISM="Rhodomonas abbreviata, Strain Caron Lab Isolate" /LENGTH=81 /DNA_ID=CAMNT_0023435957 /DNA_START=278 /DNA_END=519 /DNA_ORIENTATION=-
MATSRSLLLTQRQGSQRASRFGDSGIHGGKGETHAEKEEEWQSSQPPHKPAIQVSRKSHLWSQTNAASNSPPPPPHCLCPP